MMSRTADYSIQGFLYQFNKTLLELLRSPDGSCITVEGIAEDIEIQSENGTTAIQCKYHEATEQYVLSIIYKPLLQMMVHFYKNQSANIQYILFAYFPGKDSGLGEITLTDIEKVLDSTNRNFQDLIDVVKDKINIPLFLERFSLVFGEKLDEIVGNVRLALKDNGLPESEIELLFYPNAVHEIACISIRHDEDDRKITKKQFLQKLRSIRKTAISRWTLALNSRKQLLDARKKQLKTNLNKNVRVRYFFFSCSDIENFSDEIVIFISDYLDKYHYKQAHVCTPLFCLDCSQDVFENICLRLYKKGIISESGFIIPNHFDRFRFFRDPMVTRKTPSQVSREFHIRLLNSKVDNAQTIFNEHRCDDLFVIGQCSQQFNIQDVNIEVLETRTFNENKYILGLSDVIEST